MARASCNSLQAARLCSNRAREPGKSPRSRAFTATAFSETAMLRLIAQFAGDGETFCNQGIGGDVVALLSGENAGGEEGAEPRRWWARPRL